MVVYLVKSEGSEGFHEIIDFLTSSHIYYALTECPTLYISLIEQFWQTVALSTTEDGVHAITATIDGRDKIITEASIRRHLKLQDSEGLSSLPNAEVFEQLTSIGYAPTSDSEAPSTSPSRITSSPSLLSHHTTSSTLTTPPSIQITHEAEETATMPHDSPLPGGHTPGSDEGRLKHDELMELVTKLSDRVVAVEEDLKQTKKTYNTALTKLVLKVKKLEKQFRSGKEDIETQDKNSDDTEVLLEEATPTELIEDLGSGEKGEKKISTADVPVSTTGAAKAKGKGKAIMQELEPPKKLKKRVQVQMSIDKELARKIQEAKAMTIDWSDPAVLRYRALQNRPYYVAKVRKNMVMYLKNQAGYKKSYFKGMKYKEIRPIFKKVWDQTHTFVPMDSEDKEKDSENKGSRKKSLARKRAGEKQSKESTKRQKIKDDVEKEELKAYLDLVLREEFAMEIESLATKADRSFKNYKIFSEMLDDFDRQDVLDLHRLVKARYMTSSPEGYDLMLWGDLKILFEPDEEDEVWRNQHEYNLISWRLFDSCGIHILLMNNGIAIHMMIEKKYPLTQEMLSKMLSRKLEVDHENEMAFELLRFVLVVMEDAKQSGGSPIGIHGLFSGRYCGLAGRMVTLRVSTAGAKEVTTGTLVQLKRLINRYWEIVNGLVAKRLYVIVCHEAVVRIPLEGDEILRVHGERTQGVVKTLMNTKSKEEHEVHLKLVLESQRKEKLYAKDNSKEWNSGDDQLRLRWIIYLVVLADAAESVRDAIGFEYSLASSSGWTKSPVLWAEIGESSLTGLELVQETTDKVVLVKEKPKAARDRQKSYVDYRLRLLEELNSVHDTFHVSNLKKCLADANLHVPLDEINVDKTLHFVEEPVDIMD
ncbi:hypothetical protein Tco_0188720 [Tanacetum coccineum]